AETKIRRIEPTQDAGDQHRVLLNGVAEFFGRNIFALVQGQDALPHDRQGSDRADVLEQFLQGFAPFGRKFLRNNGGCKSSFTHSNRPHQTRGLANTRVNLRHIWDQCGGENGRRGCDGRKECAGSLTPAVDNVDFRGDWTGIVFLPTAPRTSAAMAVSNNLTATLDPQSGKQSV